MISKIWRTFLSFISTKFLHIVLRTHQDINYTFVLIIKTEAMKNAVIWYDSLSPTSGLNKVLVTPAQSTWPKGGWMVKHFHNHASYNIYTSSSFRKDPTGTLFRKLRWVNHRITRVRYQGLDWEAPSLFLRNSPHCVPMFNQKATIDDQKLVTSGLQPSGMGKNRSTSHICGVLRFFT